jgi:hypothetical protein
LIRPITFLWFRIVIRLIKPDPISQNMNN